MIIKVYYVKHQKNEAKRVRQTNIRINTIF
jgi:hypothetical protein